MSDSGGDRRDPAEARLGEHLALLRTGIDPPGRSLVRRIVRTARRQRVIRLAVRAAANLVGAALGAMGGLLGGGRGR